MRYIFLVPYWTSTVDSLVRVLVKSQWSHEECHQCDGVMKPAVSEKGFGLVCGYSKASHRSVLFLQLQMEKRQLLLQKKKMMFQVSNFHMLNQSVWAVCSTTQNQRPSRHFSRKICLPHITDFFAVLFGNPALHLSFIAAGFFFFFLLAKKRKKSWWVCFSFWLIKRGHVKGTHQLLLTMVQCWVLFESHVLCL